MSTQSASEEANASGIDLRPLHDQEIERILYIIEHSNNKQLPAGDNTSTRHESVAAHSNSRGEQKKAEGSKCRRGSVAAAHSNSRGKQMKAEGSKCRRGLPSNGALELGVMVPLKSSTEGGSSSAPRVNHATPLAGASDASAPCLSVKKLEPHRAPLGGGLADLKPHIFTVQAGEDVASRAMSFSGRGWAVYILSANGEVSVATLRHGDSYGQKVTYVGCFEIISFSGTYLPSDSSRMGSRTGGLTVTLACPNGRVFGGSLSGRLTAASPVQVVIGRFPYYAQKVLDLNFTLGST